MVILQVIIGYDIFEYLYFSVSIASCYAVATKDISHRIIENKTTTSAINIRIFSWKLLSCNNHHMFTLKVIKMISNNLELKIIYPFIPHGTVLTIPSLVELQSSGSLQTCCLQQIINRTKISCVVWNFLNSIGDMRIRRFKISYFLNAIFREKYK